MQWLLVFGCLAATVSARAETFESVDTRGMPRSAGVVARVDYPAGWKRVPSDDGSALVELRGPVGRVTGIVQIGRGRIDAGTAERCRRERAPSMLANVDEPGVRVTEVWARAHQGRPAFELRYRRGAAGDWLAARSLIVCLKDSRLVLTCAATGATRESLAEIEPTCVRAFDSFDVTEE